MGGGSPGPLPWICHCCNHSCRVMASSALIRIFSTTDIFLSVLAFLPLKSKVTALSFKYFVFLSFDLGEA